MMIIKDDLKYSKEHEWVKIAGNKAYIGILIMRRTLLEILFL